MHAKSQEGYCIWVGWSVGRPVGRSVGRPVGRSVCPSVCLSVKSHLTSGASVGPVTYSADNEGKKICGVFSETAPLQRSSTPSVESHTSVGHFPAADMPLYARGAAEGFAL